MDASSDRARRNRRRGAAAFGLIALPVVGTAFVLPAVADATTGPTVAAVAPASSATTDPDQAAVQAYLDAGYSFDDAVTLASLWDLGEDAYQLKVQAGGFLADGVALNETPFANPDLADTFTPEQLIEVFVGAGYTVGDATVLAQEWGVDLTEAKVRAGHELKTVGVLPFVDAAIVGDAAVTSFFDAGYDYEDAAALAGFWGLPTPYDAKVKAGTWIEEGQALPAVPGVGN